jgi:hypothetical protein
MSFYICHCGNTIGSHNFKHQYVETAEILRDMDENCNEFFILNADDFPVKTGTRCAKADCTADIRRHGTILLEHAFEPVNYTYREIKLSLPLDTQCNKDDCKQLKDHKDVMTHHFSTKVIVKNKQENDIITIINPEDEDIKIIVGNNS